MVERRRIRVVELPVNASEDRVVGTIDTEAAIKRGERRFEPGLLADANRGILYVDEINLLDDHIVDVLLDAAAMGWNVVEREGISFAHPSRFILVGTMNPEEGELRPQLLDRFGLCVDITGLHDIDERVRIIEREARRNQTGTSLDQEFQAERGSPPPGDRGSADSCSRASRSLRRSPGSSRWCASTPGRWGTAPTSW